MQAVGTDLLVVLHAGFPCALFGVFLVCQVPSRAGHLDQSPTSAIAEHKYLLFARSDLGHGKGMGLSFSGLVKQSSS